MKIYFEHRTFIGFIIALVILAYLGIFSYLNNRDFIRLSQKVSRINEVLYHIEQLHANIQSIEANLRGYILTLDTGFSTSYITQTEKILTHTQTLQRLTSDNPSQQRRIASLRSSLAQKIRITEKIKEAASQSRDEALNILTSPENRTLRSTTNRLITSMQQEENDLLKQRIKGSENKITLFNIAFSTLFITIGVILIIIFLAINTHLKARLQAESRTKQLNKELEAFTYSVSHDLRSPLRAINGYTRMLQEDYEALLDDEGKRILGVIIKNAARMGQLIDDLLDFSRIGRKELARSKVDIDGIVRNTVRELTGHEEGREITFTIHPLDPAYGDINMLQQVWANFISNAIKYTRKADPARIEIGNTITNGQAVYYIKDNGVGFDMQYAGKLFKVFQRLHTTEEFEGTGVGLALVHRIVTRHHGQVWAESEENKGATFYFSIPDNPNATSKEYEK